MTDTLQQLLDERAIYRQLIRFARAMDERDWSTLGTLMTTDVMANFGTGDIAGNDSVVAFIRSFLDNCGTTQHLLGNISIEVTGNVARSRAYVADMHLSADPRSQDSFRTLGDYSDYWVKNGDVWLISKRVKDNRATVGTMAVFSRTD